MQRPSHPALDALDEALDWFAEAATGAERQRRLPQGTVAMLRQLGVLRLVQPATHGGLESEPLVFFEAVRRLGTVCGSSAWVAGVVGIHNWHLGLYSAKAQEMVWGDDADTWMCSSYVPNGRAERVPGGYRLNGRWSFSSGADHSDWALLGAMVDGAEPGLGSWLSMLVPRRDFTVTDTWNAIGLRGTGSNDIAVDSAFVADHAVLNFADIVGGTCPGSAPSSPALYRMPWHAMFASSILAPLIGIAGGAVAGHLDHQRRRSLAGGVIPAAPEEPTVAMRFAEAASDVDAAWLQLCDGLGEMWGRAQAGLSIEPELRARLRRDQVVGVSRCRGAVERLFEVAGGRGLSTGSAVQRMWRDAHAAASHVVNASPAALRAYHDFVSGKAELESLL